MTRERINFSSGVHWEPLRGYSRAVKVGEHLYISGTTAMTISGDVVGTGSAYEQTRYVFQRLKSILTDAGFQITDVVRTRMFVTHIDSWNDYARAHSEVFDKIRPASSIVQVAKLVDPRLLVEIEADALLGCEYVDTKVLTA